MSFLGRLAGRAQHPPQSGWEDFSNEPVSIPAFDGNAGEWAEICLHVIDNGGSWDCTEEGLLELSYGRKSKVFGPHDQVERGWKFAKGAA